ncbi:hypothetical protein LVY72_04305 [Arthrobacter sp. I2-34]|uniref:Uncharacterized protein n=1 Tax=Arthrobacter hankyongi TaxID=2904801 RepID=A0ABS9L3Q9_9MICC|nr:hypothetical protein [Arthrobacter hankyongi]MCG2621134.1 hypothetical protein [Arthrobacter hankyongi]
MSAAPAGGVASGAHLKGGAYARGYIHHSFEQRAVFTTGGFAEELAAEIQRRGAGHVLLIARPRTDAEVLSALRAAASMVQEWLEVTQHIVTLISP